MTGIFTTKYFGTYGKEIGNANFLVSFFVLSGNTEGKEVTAK